jgi:hypothetical protein
MGGHEFTRIESAFHISVAADVRRPIPGRLLGQVRIHPGGALAEEFFERHDLFGISGGRNRDVAVGFERAVAVRRALQAMDS